MPLVRKGVAPDLKNVAITHAGGGGKRQTEDQSCRLWTPTATITENATDGFLFPKNWTRLPCRNTQPVGFKANRKLSAFLDQF
jgi:hypothetical protein